MFNCVSLDSNMTTYSDSVNTTMFTMPIKTSSSRQIQKYYNQPLPNDTDDTTRFKELQFLNEFHEFVQVGAESTTCSNDHKDFKAILCSRTTGKSYYWPNKFNLTAEQMRPYFCETGHTFTIDYSRSYVRQAAWDLDCIHRVSGNAIGHISERQAIQMCENISKLLQQITKMAKIPYDVWSLDCGYHVYFDLTISLPLHLYITHILQADTSNAMHILLEMPEQMPLPFSSKYPRRPYTLWNSSQPYNNVPLFPTSDIYYDMVTYLNTPTGIVLCTITERHTIKYICTEENTMAFKCTSIPKFPRVVSCVMDPKYEYMSSHLATYILSTQDNTQKMGTLQIDVCDTDSLSLNKYATELNAFIINYNTRIYGADSDTETWLNFIYASIEQNGCLFLQPYVVYLHKWLLNRNDELTFDEFLTILQCLYGNEAKHRKSVARFLNYYNFETLRAYDTVKLDHMLDYFQQVCAFQITIDMSNQTIITKYMEHVLGTSDIQKYCNDLSVNKKGDALKQNFVNALISVLESFHLVIYEPFSCTWFMLQNEGFYEAERTFSLPLLNTWFVNNESLIKWMNRYILSKCDEFKITCTLWSESKYMIATKVGVFNSITGLYTAKTPFMRFLKYRTHVIWYYGNIENYDNNELLMSNQQNEKLVTIYENLEPFIDSIDDHITNLFIHFQLAPAIIDMRNQATVDMMTMRSFFEKLGEYDDLSNAYFLIEYYPINIKFVHAIIAILNDQNYNHCILYDYTALKSTIFMSQYVVTINDWRKKFTDDDMAYDEYAITYMERLTSLKSKFINKPSERMCFYATLIALFMIKCCSFRDFVYAFNAQRLPDIGKQHDSYLNAVIRSDLKSVRENLKRAKKIIFGKITQHENQLVDMLVKICMSSCFTLENIYEVLNVFSNLCINVNVNRKFFLFYGPACTGKSYMSNLVAKLCAPLVHRATDLTVAITRSQITVKNTAIVVNEMSAIDEGVVKTVTGGDKESTSAFYTQAYTMSSSPGFMFGATNQLIDFNGKARHKVEQAAINRMHPLFLEGEQIKDDANNRIGLIKMVAGNQYYESVMPDSEELDVEALRWLSYIWYFKKRFENYQPPVNLQNSRILNYQNKLYIQNNHMYNFMTKCGLSESRDMYIETKKLISCVKSEIQTAEQKIFTCYYEFKRAFDAHYSTTLGSSECIKNIIETHLLNFIERNFTTLPCKCPNGPCSDSITQDDLDKRKSIFTDIIYQENSLSYFSKKNAKYFNADTCNYDGVHFEISEIESYDYNTFSSSFAMDSNFVSSSV